MALTRRQREIYDYVCEFIAEHGYSPSLEEIGARFELASVATVHKHVAQLVAKGWLRKSWNRSRSLEPVGADPAAEALTLPLLGVVAAGAPIEPVEIEERIAVPRELVRRPETSFVLRVRGDSMIDEQIRDGDFVIVERRSEARDGDTVVAVVRGGEATLKKWQRRGPVVRLIPANARMKPIEVPLRDVEVRGVVRALMRSY
ncbi:MAG: repressor LexA [Proteobacteria bacterium]|nr:MAG: repressor LexA [Pseudomonadota bacterium]